MILSVFLPGFAAVEFGIIEGPADKASPSEEGTDDPWRLEIDTFPGQVTDPKDGRIEVIGNSAASPPRPAARTTPTLVISCMADLSCPLNSSTAMAPTVPRRPSVDSTVALTMRANSRSR